MIKDNNFIRDSFTTRMNRLRNIQTNIASIQPELNAPAHIIAWSENCYDIFTNMLTESDVDGSFSISATSTTDAKYDLMVKEYQNIRTLGITIYQDYPIFLKDFGFNSAFPKTKNNGIARVEQVLETNERQIAGGVTPLLPAALITRLTEAKDEYIAALQEKERLSSVARHSKSALGKHFADDTRLLKELRAWLFINIGNNSWQISAIGMVDLSKRGPKRKRSKEEEIISVAEKSIDSTQ